MVHDEMRLDCRHNLRASGTRNGAKASGLFWIVVEGRLGREGGELPRGALPLATRAPRLSRLPSAVPGALLRVPLSMPLDALRHSAVPGAPQSMPLDALRRRLARLG